jgi:uncharacterized protein DUF5995
VPIEAPSPIADVVARMHALVASLPRRDGVSCFVRLYLAVTEGVQAQLGGLDFAAPQFTMRLDVIFADLFFSALDAYEHNPADTPSAWVPLLESRSRRGIAALQFALAGMNAHINRDLPVALVTTCRELGTGLDDGTPQHGDYERINPLLATVEAQMEQQYVTGWLRRIEHLLPWLHRLDDVAAMWDIARARDAAWTNAQALWAMRDDPGLAADFLTTLDRMVGFAGRGLLCRR